jgi:hypothetical protein
MIDLVAPIIPSSHSAARSSVTARTVRMLPLAVPQVPAAAPVDVIYGMGRLDASGRVADQVISRVLGWQPGDRLTLTGTPNMVTARRDPAGILTLGRKPYMTVPAALRNRCGLRAGDRVLLAATPAENLLAVYPLITVHQAIHSLAAGGETR